MSHEDLGHALDRMQSEAKYAQADSEAAAALLAGYRSTLRSQQVHLDRLLKQIETVREQVTAIDRWHDDGGAHV